MTAQRTDEVTAVWDRRLPANRDRSGLLGADEIAAVALAVAEAEGLAAASVKRVATRLRVPANRLEHYVTSRDELQDLMLDHLLGQLELPAADQAWPDQLAGLAREFYRLAHERRCVIELIGARSPSGPHGLRFVERALDAFATTGVDVRIAALSFNALLSYVCGAVSFETRPGGATRRQANRAADRADYLSHVVAAGEHPRLGALFATAADITSAESFEHGLGCLLDGIAARIAGGRTGYVARHDDAGTGTSGSR